MNLFPSISIMRWACRRNFVSAVKRDHLGQMKCGQPQSAQNVSWQLSSAIMDSYTTTNTGFASVCVYTLDLLLFGMSSMLMNVVHLKYRLIFETMQESLTTVCHFSFVSGKSMPLLKLFRHCLCCQGFS